MPSTLNRWAQRRRQGGYTLTEILIVAVVMSAVFGMGMYGVMEAGRNAWLTGDAQWDSEIEAQRVVDRISEDLRAASAATVICGADTLTIGTGATQVVYVYAPDADGGTLTRTQDGAATTVGSRLTGFALPSCVNGVVQLQVTSRGTTPGGRDFPQTINTFIWVQVP